MNSWRETLTFQVKYEVSSRSNLASWGLWYVPLQLLQRSYVYAACTTPILAMKLDVLLHGSWNVFSPCVNAQRENFMP